MATMAGFVAVIAHDRHGRGLDEDAALLERAYSGLRPSERVSRLSVGDWVRGAQFERPGEQSGSGTTWLLGGTLHPGMDPATAPLADLRGRFALVRHDAVLDRVEVASDPLGMFRLYAAERADRTYVSTSAIALARHLRADPHELGMLFYLRAGTQYGPLTHWEGVERIDPGTVLIFDTGKARRA